MILLKLLFDFFIIGVDLLVIVDLLMVVNLFIIMLLVGIVFLFFIWIFCLVFNFVVFIIWYVLFFFINWVVKFDCVCFKLLVCVFLWFLVKVFEKLVNNIVINNMIKIVIK